VTCKTRYCGDRRRRTCVTQSVIIQCTKIDHNICTLLQAGRTVQEEMPPPLNSLVMGMMGLALVALIVSITVCLWKRKEMSKCVTRSGKSRQSSSGSVSMGLHFATRETQAFMLFGLQSGKKPPGCVVEINTVELHSSGINWDSEPSRYVENPDNWIFLGK